jgi:hypothetical protein
MSNESHHEERAGAVGAVGSELAAAILTAVSHGFAVTVRPGEGHVKLLADAQIIVEAGKAGGQTQHKTLLSLEVKVPIVGEQLLARTIAELAS